PTQRVVADVVAEAAGAFRQVGRHAVVVTGGQSQVAVSARYALLVHHRLDFSHVVKARRHTSAFDEQGALRGGNVHHGDVDVAGQLLLGSIAQALLLQSIAQFGGVHDPRHRSGEADSRGDGQLGVVVKVGRHVHTRVGHGDIGLRTPDDVVGPLHHRLVGGVNRDVARQNKGVLEAFQEVFKRDAFFFRE
ncbi:MAG: hypothetical protein AN487_23220, partial [Anabaena sp. CRKS33]